MVNVNASSLRVVLRLLVVFILVVRVIGDSGAPGVSVEGVSHSLGSSHINHRRRQEVGTSETRHHLRRDKKCYQILRLRFTFI